MTNQEYHQAEGLSASDFRLLQISPLHLEHKSLFSMDSKSISIGSALHSLVLEPQNFHNEFSVEEEFNKRTKAGKEEYEKWCQINKDKTILSKTEFEKVQKMAKNVLNITQNLLSNGIAEKSFLVKDYNGIIRKCRPDYLREDLKVVIDVKTTKDGNPFAFSKSIYEYNYHIQAAWYIDTLKLAGVDVERFIFITVESSSPHMVYILEITQDAIELGREEYKKLYDEYVAFKQSGNCNVVKQIDLPNWVYEQSA